MPLFRFRQFFKYFRPRRIFLGLRKRAVKRDAILLPQKVVRVSFEIVLGWLHIFTVSNGNLHAPIELQMILAVVRETSLLLVLTFYLRAASAA